MADRTVNININYKVNVEDVNKAAQASQRAQQATDSFNAAASKAGQSAQQGFGGATKSIEAMNIQLARLKTQIAVASNPAQIKSLSDQYKTLKTQIDAATKSAYGLPKALNETKVATQGVTQSFGGFVTAVRSFIAAGIVKEVFNIAIEMSRLSGQVEGVERAFQKQIPNSVALLRDLRKATQGTSTDLDLMSKTLQAKNLGVPVQNLATFFEFAAIRAQQTGISVDYLTQSIVNGLGRKSTRVIDNLGISATRLKDEFHGVSLEQLSVAEVSQGLANIIQEEMGKMGDYVETAATDVDRLSVSWQKLKEVTSSLNAGDVIAYFTGIDAGAFTLTGHLKAIIEGLADAAEMVKRGISASQLYEERQIKEIAAISENEFVHRVLKGTREENIKAVEDEIKALTQELGVYAAGRGFANDRIKSIYAERDAITARRFLSIKESDDFRERIKIEEKLRDAKKEDFSIDQEILKLLQARLQVLKQVNDEEVEATGIIERKKKEIEGLQEAIEKTNNPKDLSSITGGTVVVGELIKQLAIAQAELADLQREFSDFDVKPLKIKIEDVTKAILNFDDAAKNSHGLGALFDDNQTSIIDRNINNIEASFARLAEMNPFTKPGQTVAKQDTFWSELGKEFKDNWRDILGEGIDIQAGFIDDALNAELDSMKRQLGALRNFYDEQQLLAGDNERAKKELRVREEKATTELSRKIFEKEKKTRRAQAIVDGAAGVAKAFASYPYPAAIIISALIAAQVAAQIAAINRQKSGYAKGVIDLKGPGTGTSDSIPANLSRGESVMTARETQDSKGILKAIRNKQLDDRIIKNLHVSSEGVRYQEMNDERIVDAIRSIPETDVIKKANTLYEVKMSRDKLYKKIKRKSMN